MLSWKTLFYYFIEIYLNFKKNGISFWKIPFDCRLTQPFNLLVYGPSKSGKTTFISNLLEVSKDMFNKKSDQIILYYANK